MTIIIFIIVLAVLILVHEFGHFIIAKKSGIRVDEFGLGFPPRLFGYKPKGSETTYTLNLIPFGGFVKIFGENPDDESISGTDSDRSLVNKPKYIQAFVLIGGILFNFLFAWLLISSGFLVGLPYQSGGRYSDMVEGSGVVLTSILPNSPAESAGLLPGDEIVSLGLEDGSILNADLITDRIKGSNGNVLPVTYDRGGEISVAEVVPEKGILGDIYAIGISMGDIGTLKLPLHLAIWEGLRTSSELFVDIAVGLSTFIYQAVSGQADLSGIAGPVGIAGLVGDASALGFVTLMSFVAFISLNLAVLNLIPFPALDGGRLFFLLIEKIKGSPIKPKIFNIVNTVGFLLLISLLLIVTYNDIIRLF